MTAWLMVMLTSAYVITTVAMYRSNRQTAQAAQKKAAAAVLQAEAIQKQIEVFIMIKMTHIIHMVQIIIRTIIIPKKIQ